MNIRDAQINMTRTDGVRNGYVNGVSRVAGGAAATKAGVESSRAKDSVEISEAGRAAASDAQTRELGFAKKALESVPTLSADRAAEIRGRIESGFYTKPEVVSAVAGRITDELRGA